MTHDKVRQDFYALFPDNRLEKIKNTETIEAAFEGYLLGRAAERAEIREKLESGMVAEGLSGVIVSESRKGGAYGFAHISAIGIAKAAITKILEVI